MVILSTHNLLKAKLQEMQKNQLDPKNFLAKRQWIIYYGDVFL